MWLGPEGISQKGIWTKCQIEERFLEQRPKWEYASLPWNTPRPCAGVKMGEDCPGWCGSVD